MKTKTKFSIMISFLLTLVMVVGLLPMVQVAYAASAVSNLTWDGNTAKWDTDGSASQFKVLLKVGPSDINSIVIANNTVDVTSIDYSSYLLPGNTYYFHVAPIVGSEQQSFEHGPAKTIEGSIETISPITIDSDNKIATWPSVTGADGYDVWVLKDSTQIGIVKQTTDTSYDFSNEYLDTGNGDYSVRVGAYKISRGNYMATGESSKVSLNELPATVTINFDSNGGTGTMDDVTIAYASYYTLPDCSFTPPAGQEFDCWEINGGRIGAGTNNKFFANTKIKALWKAETVTPITYTVTFVPGEGSGTPFTSVVNAGEKLLLPSCSFIAPENKVFDKWDKGEPNDQIDVSSDMTVTALWKETNSYTVTVNVNNAEYGTAFASPTSGPSGTVVTLTATPNPGYKFKEWDRNAGMFANGAYEVPNATSATTTFTIGSYNVEVTAIFEADGTTTKTLDSIAITTPPTKTEYTEGDSFDPTGMMVEATYSDGSSAPVMGYTVSPTGALTISDTFVTVTYTEDGVTKTTKQTITVNAASVPTVYTVTVNVNNAEYGTAIASPTSGPSGTVVTLTATPNPGYKFKEWQRNAGMFANGTLEITNATSATTTITIGSYNVVVTAIFEAVATHTHSYGTDWKSDADKHWHECDCGAKNDEEAHTAGDWIIDTEATATTDGTKHKECTVCHRLLENGTIPATGSGEHTHSYGTEWKSDVNKHWHECDCGAKNDEEAHSAGEWIIDTEATATTDGTKHKECTVCHRVLENGTIPATGGAEHTHSYGSEWKSDVNKHWHECDCGAKNDEEAHSAGEWIIDTEATATTEGAKHKECTVCGYVTEIDTIPATGGAEHTHSYGSEWKANADKHWHECDCGDKADEAAHIDENNDGKCDICDYEMGNADNQGGEIKPEKTGLSGGAIAGIIVGSVAVAGLGGFSIFWFVIKKKKFADLIALFKK